MGHLSTHVLDTAHGCPAAGMKVTLQRVDADGRAQLVRSITLKRACTRAAVATRQQPSSSRPR